MSLLGVAKVCCFCVLQEHHSAREVFLTETTDDNDAETLLAKVTVCAPRDLTRHQDDDDVFVCDHMYHRGCSVGLTTASCSG